ncbi:DUF502 domain-containing protein [candidate division KSB3 bacterium]|uniref:DUF502 domain-containing protein n=1 Tax=candidate division KSB3 bacterium TaxID=2044937 RepID=A0A9D5JZW5_9BACT|nr:DUF502 domain-containing protein [candidate division KSB3 bacterium]MBD3327362.1 DUF502 domain-containing protein [candidate division KSB3 bacterium]
MAMLRRLRHRIERIFLAGVLVTVPAMITFLLLKFLVNYIDKVSAPIVERVFHTQVPGIGFSVTILIVLAVGFFGTNFIGKHLVSFGDYLLSQIPLVRSIYTSAKQIIETAIFATEKPFHKVVLVPYPRDGVYAIGLVTREVAPDIDAAKTELPTPQPAPESKHDQMLSVFIPSTPNFTSGLLVMFPRRDIIPLAMTIEEGFKYLMSGGILVPKHEQDELQDLQDLEEWDLFLY